MWLKKTRRGMTGRGKPDVRGGREGMRREGRRKEVERRTG